MSAPDIPEAVARDIEEFGATLQRGTCGTCDEEDVKIAVINIDSVNAIKLCGDCLVDLANEVYFRELPDD